MNSQLFKWRSLKVRVTLFTLLIYVLGIWLLAFYASRTLRDNMQKVLGEQQFSTVSFMADEVDDELKSRVKALETVAADISPELLVNPAALQIMLEQRPVFQTLFNAGTVVTGLEGTVIADVPLAAKRIGVNYRDRDFSMGALQGKTTVGRPVMGRTLHVPVFAIAAPIRGAQGQVIGVLIGAIDLSHPSFLEHLTASHYGKSGDYLLVAPKQRLVVTSSNRRRIMEILPAAGINPAIDRFINGFEGVEVFLNPLGVEVMAAVKGVPTAGWYVAVALPTAEAFSPIRDMQQRLLFAALFLCLLAGALSWWMVRHQLSPMLTAIKALTALSDTTQQPHPLPITSHDEIGELIGGFNHLLATLKQREQALRASEEIRLKNLQLEEASRVKSEFLATMSHELRTPLNAIIGFSEALKDGQMGPLTPDQHEYIGDIYTSGEHLLSLINDILDLSKVESGMMTLELEPIELQALLQNSLSMVKEKAMQHHLKLTLLAAPELPELVADPRKLKQIVFNLLSNAVKFTPDGGSVTLAAQQVAGMLELSVTDTGIGISQEDQARLFQPFSQIDSSLSRHHQGTGLGLVMVKRLAELHGGSAGLTSAPGQGARFWVRIPWRSAVLPS